MKLSAALKLTSKTRSSGNTQFTAVPDIYTQQPFYSCSWTSLCYTNVSKTVQAAFLIGQESNQWQERRENDNNDDDMVVQCGSLDWQLQDNDSCNETGGISGAQDHQIPFTTSPRTLISLWNQCL